MQKKKDIRIIVAFCVGFSVLFGIGIFFNLPVPLIKSSLLVALMALFFFNQHPRVLAICGALGWVYIGYAATRLYDFSQMADWGKWLLEIGLYGCIYALVWRFCIWLTRLNAISTQHEMVIAGTTAGLWKWDDMSKDAQWWSPRYYQLLGYQNNEIPATLTNLGDLIHPEDRDKAFKVLQDYIAGLRDNLEFEYRIRTKSGEYKWFLGSGQVQFEPNTRKPLMIVGSIVDIDHKKKYELALAQQAALFELSPNAVITMDLDMVVRTWNEGAEKLYDIKAADAIGRNLRALLSINYPYSTQEEVRAYYDEHGEWGGEVQQVTIAGKKINALSSIKRYCDQNGEPIGVMAVNSDLSLLRINKELSMALTMLESSTQYLEQLAYISAHDLKSPIATMQGLLNHLQLTKAIMPGHEATFEMIREIVEQMKSTSVSLSSILHLRKTLHSREFASEKVSLAQVVRDVQEMLRSQVAAADAQVETDIEKGLQARIPHTFLKSILFNLMSNAIKFRYPGRKPEIRIEAHAKDGMLCISVRDNGSGIHLERYRNKLFAIFARFHEGGVEGNGIGLHSVKMIVDFYKGDIDVVSEKGKGSVFTVKLPLEPDGQN
jgi:PAS domain S-box-containing protein